MSESAWEQASPLYDSESSVSEESDEPVTDGVTIAFEDLSVHVRGTDKSSLAIRDVSGMFRAGRVTGLLGTESSGAEELMKCVAGFQKPTEGRVYANGLPIEASLYRKCVGYVSKHLLDRLTLTVKQNLLFTYRMKTKQTKCSSVPDESTDGMEIQCPHCSTKTTRQVCPKCQSLIEGWRLASKVIGLPENGNCVLSQATVETRKRVDLAAELLHLPKVLFLEAPIEQLDLSSGLRLIKLLKALAKDRGMAVIMTLLQPRRPVFELLDDVFLLDNGGVAYAGKTSGVLRYFQQNGYEVDEYDCPSDYFLDLTSRETPLDMEQADERTPLIATDAGSEGDVDPSPKSKSKSQTIEPTPLVRQWNESSQKKELINSIIEYYQAAFANVTPGIPDIDAPSSLARLGHLIRFQFFAILNSWRQAAFKLLVVVFLGFVAGLVYSGSYDVETYGLQNRVGMLFFILCAVLLGSMGMASEYVARRPLVGHEIAAGYYTMTQYMAALLFVDVLVVRGLLTVIFGFVVFFFMGFDWVGTVENRGFVAQTAPDFDMLLLCMAVTQWPFSMLSILVGALSPTATYAQYVMFFIFAVFVAFGGLFVNSASLNVPLNVMQYVSVLRLSYESLLVHELRGRSFDCNNTDDDCFTGDNYLALQGFHEDNLWANIQVLGALSVFYLMLAGIAIYVWGLR
ncbi:ABC transporter G family member 22 [Diplonema papillatum]|nr:ABC transporter G family member 22 [Diplonema papillatum]